MKNKERKLKLVRSGETTATEQTDEGSSQSSDPFEALKNFVSFLPKGYSSQFYVKNLRPWIELGTSATVTGEQDKQTEDQTMATPERDKYLDERFKHIDSKIDHTRELLSLKIDSLAEKVTASIEESRHTNTLLSEEINTNKQMLDSLNQRVDSFYKFVTGNTIAVILAALTIIVSIIGYIAHAVK